MKRRASSLGTVRTQSVRVSLTIGAALALTLPLIILISRNSDSNAGLYATITALATSVLGVSLAAYRSEVTNALVRSRRLTNPVSPLLVILESGGPISTDLLRQIGQLGTKQNLAVRQEIIDSACLAIKSISTADTANVRALQGFISNHLSDSNRHDGDLFWPGICLDLTAARLYNFDASGFHVKEIRLDLAEFIGPVFMTDMVVDRQAMFSRATFHDSVDFSRAQFLGVASFDSTLFGSDAIFDGCTFSSLAIFGGARFNAEASFRWLSVVGPLWAESARFDGPTTFGRSQFNSDVSFGNAFFASDLDLSFCRFDSSLFFRSTRLGTLLDFHGASFAGSVVLDVSSRAKVVNTSDASARIAQSEIREIGLQRGT